MSESKEWQTPEVKEVILEEDSTSGDCQGKKIGCYAGSSCGSIKKDQQDQPQPRESEKK